MISIVIPVYNQAAYIGEMLASILRQTYTDYEIIIVDDGSTDDLSAALVPYQSAIAQFIQQANAGVSAARNRGLAAARGEYIAFYDADDWLVDDALLAESVKLLEAPPKPDVVHSGWYIGDESGAPLIAQRAWVYAQRLNALTWLTKAPIRLTGMLFRREGVIRLGGFDERLHHAEDSDFLWRMALTGARCVWYAACTNVYHQHAQNTVRRYPRKQIHMTYAVAARMVHHPRFPYLLRPVRNRFLYGKAVWAVFSTLVLEDAALTQAYMRLSLGLSTYTHSLRGQHMAMLLGKHSYSQYQALIAPDWIVQQLSQVAPPRHTSIALLGSLIVWGYYLWLAEQNAQAPPLQVQLHYRQHLRDLFSQSPAYLAKTLLPMLCWVGKTSQAPALLASIFEDAAACGQPIPKRQQAQAYAFMVLLSVAYRRGQSMALMRLARVHGFALRDLPTVLWAGAGCLAHKITFLIYTPMMSLFTESPSIHET